MKQRIMIDADTGTDDALALLLAVHTEHVALEGVIAGAGNVGAGQAARNTLKVLELAGRSDVPVIQGAAAPLLRPAPAFDTTRFHGQDGMGDLGLPDARGSVQPIDAVDFVTEKLNQYGKKLTLICLGRLTGIAMLLRKDPSMASRIGRLVLMGGAVDVPGNVEGVAELNILGDPDAAQLVLSAPIPITMVGLDVTLKAMFREHHLSRLERLCAGSTRADIQAALKLLRFRMNAYQRNFGEYATPLHDPLAVAIALYPELATFEQVQIDVNTTDPELLGATTRQITSNAERATVRLCTQIDHDQFIDTFIRTLAAGSQLST